MPITKIDVIDCARAAIRQPNSSKYFTSFILPSFDSYRRYKSYLLEVCLCQDTYIDISVRYFIFKEYISDHELEVSNEKVEDIIKKLFFFFDKEIYIYTVLSKLIKAGDFDPNIIVDGLLFLEYIITKKNALGSYFLNIAEEYLSLSIDYNMASPLSSRSIIGVLIDESNMSLLELAISRDFKCKINVDIAILISRFSINASSDFISEFESLLKAMPTSMKQLEDRGEVSRVLSSLYKTVKSKNINSIVHDLLMSQAQKNIFLEGIALFIMSLPKIIMERTFLQMLEVIELDEFISAIESSNDLQSERVIDFIWGLNYPNYDESRVVCGKVDRFILSEVEKRSLSAAENYNSGLKDISLLFGLSGESKTFGNFAGGMIEDSAWYLYKLISEIPSYDLANKGVQKADLMRAICKSAYRTSYFFNDKSSDSSSSHHVMKGDLAASARTTGALILTGWPGHAISMLFQNDYFLRCNGGGCSYDSTIEVYTVGDKSALTDDFFDKLYRAGEENNKEFIQREIHSVLNLKLVCKHEWVFQYAPNCSMHSVLLGVQASIALMLSRARGEEIDFRVLEESGEIMHSLLERLKYRAVANIVNADIKNRELLFSRLLSFSAKEGASVNRMIACQLINEGVLVVNDMTLASQIYTCFLLGAKTGDEGAFEDFKSFLASVGHFPFNKSKAYGKFSSTLLSAIKKEFIANEQITDFSNNIADLSLLHVAAINDDLELAQRVIELSPRVINRADINAVAPIGYIRTLGMLELMIASKSRIDWGSRYSKTLLFKIAGWANYEIVDVAVGAGALVTQEALSLASSNPDVNVMELLLLNSNSLSLIATHSRRTPLHFAARAGSIPHLKILLGRREFRNKQEDVNGVTPVYDSVRFGREEAALYLSRCPLILPSKPHRGDSITSIAERTAIDKELCFEMESHQKEKERCINYFKNEFCRRDDLSSIRAESEHNPIAWIVAAIKINDIRAYKGAILSYPSLNLTDYDVYHLTTPLHALLESEIPDDIIQEAIELPGNYLLCFNSHGDSLAHAAIKFNKTVAIKALKDCGAPFDEPGSYGLTPLMLAAREGNLDALKIIAEIDYIRFGAISSSGKSAIDYALESTSYISSDSRQDAIDLILSKQVCSRPSWPKLYAAPA